MRHRHWITSATLLLVLHPGARAQEKKDDDMQGMPGMSDAQMQGMKMGGTGLISMQPETFPQEIVRHAGSGTSAEPDSTPAPMLMTEKGAWTLMFHANVFVLDEQQSSPRGGDKFFSTNWFMGMAQREAGPGVFTVRAMLSLEPATITGRQLPAAIPARRDGVRKPDCRRPAPAQFFHGTRRALRFETGRKVACSRSTPRLSATPPSVRRHIPTALPLRKIPWPRSAIIRRTRPTWPTTS